MSDPFDVKIADEEVRRAALLTSNPDAVYGLRAAYQGRPVVVLVVESKIDGMPGFRASTPIAILMDDSFEKELELPPGVTRYKTEEN